MMQSNSAKAGKRGAPRSQKSHDAILAAALDLAQSGGPQALTVEAVAREAKVGKQTIYRWWPTRIALFIEVYDTLAPPLQSLGAARPLRDVLQELFERYRTGPTGELLAAMIALSRSDGVSRSLFENRFRVPRRDALAFHLMASGEANMERARDTADLVVALIWYALLTDPKRLDGAFADRICATALPAAPETVPAPTIEEGYVPGFGAEMVRLHMDYYAQHWNFGRNFEHHLFRDFHALMDTFDPDLDQLLRVETARGEVLGTLVIEGSNQPKGHGRVRYFIMDARIKGMGFGKKLLDQALATCRARGQTKLWLTTFKGLDAARALYERAGFEMTEEYADDAWHEGTGEVRYDLELT